MAGQKRSETRIPRERIAELLTHVNASDSVEVKVVVPMFAQQATIASIGLDPIEAEPQQVYFFDTRRLDLYKAGVILRARRIRGSRCDTVVKLRPIDPGSIDKARRELTNFKIEVDAVPGGFVCSGSLKGRCKAAEVLDVANGDAKVSSLFSKEERSFYKEHAPTKIKMDSLVTLGPTFILRTRTKPKKLARRLTVELWLFPDGSRNLELSMKAKPKEAFAAAEELRTFLEARGVEIVGGQQTKTAAAMKFFAAQRRLKRR